MRLLRSLLAVFWVLLLITGCATKPTTENDLGGLDREDEKSPADIYVQLGIAYMQEGQYQTAMKKLRRGLEMDPQNANIHNVMALLYERLNDTTNATVHFDKAIALKPRDPYILNARGSHYCKLQKFAEAEKDFLAALDNPLYPTPWIALTNAGQCAMRNSDFDKAEKYFRLALGRNSKYPPALEQMAEISFLQQNHLSARAYLERLRAVAQPTAANLWLGIRIEKALGNKEAMEGYKSELEKLFPDAPEIQYMRDAG